MTFVNAIAVTLFLFQLSFAYNSALYFNMGKKLWRHMSFSSTCFCYYMKHPNNNNKICPLRSSACFQQRFHDWFSVLRYNADERHYYITPIKYMISQIDTIFSPFQSLRMLLFYITLENLKQNYYSLVSIFSKYSVKLAQFGTFSYLHMYLPL